MKKFKLAIIQLKTTSDYSKNVENAFTLIKEAAVSGAQVIVLPEVFSCPYDADNMKIYAEHLSIWVNSKAVSMMSEASKELGVYIIGGSIPEKTNCDRVYNTCVCFDRSGEISAVHRKQHLFDISIEGGEFKESVFVKGGPAQLTTFDTEFATFGIGICYDIRFPEYSLLLAQEKHVDILVFPANFSMKTGSKHWDLLTRSRAVDCQVFVVAAAGARNSESSFESWSHSRVVSPWGEVLCEAGIEEQVLLIDLDPSVLEECRSRLQYQKQRRRDIYSLMRAHKDM